MDKNELLKLKAKTELAYEKHRKLREKLLSECTHPEVIPHSEYYPGGFDYTDCTKYWDECSICGKRLNTRTEYGNHYG